MLSDKEVNELVCKYVADGRKNKMKYIDLIMRSSMVSEMGKSHEDDNEYNNGRTRYDAIIDCLILSNNKEGILDKFDPEKATETGFCGFFRKAVKNKFKTNIKSESKHDDDVSLDESIDPEDSDSESLMSSFGNDDAGYDVIYSIANIDAYAKVIKVMLGKRKEGSTKIAWEKLFSTELISQIISERKEFADHIIENEKRYIPVVEIPFADSYLLNGCEAIEDMLKPDLRPMSDFGKNSDEPCGYPLIGAVFAKYTGKSEAAVTQQKKIYEENIKVLRENFIR